MPREQGQTGFDLVAQGELMVHVQTCCLQSHARCVPDVVSYRSIITWQCAVFLAIASAATDCRQQTTHARSSAR
eukprot:15434322-Alexandrium_andersonii.AAC.1